MSKTYAEVDCLILATTQDAVLIDTEADEPSWIPFSCLDDESKDAALEDGADTSEVTLNIEETFATKLGLI